MFRVLAATKPVDFRRGAEGCWCANRCGLIHQTTAPTLIRVAIMDVVAMIVVITAMGFVAH